MTRSSSSSLDLAVAPLGASARRPLGVVGEVTLELEGTLGLPNSRGDRGGECCYRTTSWRQGRRENPGVSVFLFEHGHYAGQGER